jgi:hypothetical protein
MFAVGWGRDFSLSKKKNTACLPGELDLCADGQSATVQRLGIINISTSSSIYQPPPHAQRACLMSGLAGCDFYFYNDSMKKTMTRGVHVGNEHYFQHTQ